MILTMDVGNTNIKTALFENDQMRKYWRISTNGAYTSDEIGILLSNLFKHDMLKMDVVEGIMISSVVPTINFTLEHMCQNYFNKYPKFVSPNLDMDIKIQYENPFELGSDRIANAVAAYREYGGPCVFIDFGTATTFGAIDKNGAFMGGCICPGLKLTSEALVSGTAKLPRFELQKPPCVIGKNTLSNLQAGLIYGYKGQVSYIVERMREEMNEPNAMVVATGGMAVLIADDDKIINKLDGILSLKGLNILYQQNK